MLKTKLLLVTLAAIAFAANETSLSTGSWNGWDGVYTLTNDLVQVKLVPQIGGKIMEFSINGNDIFWTTNEGTVESNFPLFNDNDRATDYDYGGMRCWPMPQDGDVWWNWPPPPQIDRGVYTMQEISNTSAKIELLAISPEETFGAEGTIMKRLLTMTKGSSQLTIEHRLINNTGSSLTKRGVRQVNKTQPYHNSDSKDYENFKIYFSKGTSASDGSIGYTDEDNGKKWMQPVTDFIGEVSGTDILELSPYNNQAGAKLVANSPEGWIAFTDMSEGYSYIMTADYVAGTDVYGDKNSNIIVYFNKACRFIEVEMQSELVDIADQDSMTWTTQNYRTKTAGPILDVNKAGCIRERLAIEGTEDNVLTGKYGVFYVGTCELRFNDGAQNAAKTWNITPMEAFEVNESAFEKAGGSSMAYLVVKDGNGTIVDTLDSIEYDQVPGTSAKFSPTGHKPFTLNVTAQAIKGFVPFDGPFTVNLSLVNGARLVSRSYNGASDISLPLGKGIGSGMYVLTVDAQEKSYTDTILINR